MIQLVKTSVKSALKSSHSNGGGGSVYPKDYNSLGGGRRSLLGTAKTTHFGGIGISKYSPSVYHMNLKIGQV